METKEVSAAQIKQWKAKHGSIFEIEVAIGDEDELIKGYFKKPDRKSIAAAAKFVESDPIKASEIVFSNSFIGGDKRIKDDDEAFFAASRQLKTLFKKRVAKIKKL